MTNWCVYILNCRGGRLYTGVTLDVERRFAQHLAGKGARFTRAFPPDSILVSWSCASRRVALQLEYAIKQLSAVQKQALIAGQSVKLSNQLVLEHGIWCIPSLPFAHVSAEQSMLIKRSHAE